jgi:outer membrane protein TolC
MRKLFPTCLCLVALTGCVSYAPKPLSPAQSAAGLEARRLEDPGLRSFIESHAQLPPGEWPPKKWDLNLLTLAAFYFQPNLAVARAQWSEAVAGITTAAARPNPTLTVGPGYNFSAVQGVTPWMPFGSLDLPLETAGKRGKRVSQAEQLASSARLNCAAAAWQTRASVRAALVDWSVARERAANLQGQFFAQQELSRRQEQRLAAGDISTSEATASRLALARLQLDLNDALAQRAQSQARLAEAVGVPVRALAGVEFDFDLKAAAAEDLAGADARTVALCGRADVLAALADYAAAEDALRLEIAKQYPDLHLNPGYQFDQGEHKWTLGFTFELPVLNRNEGPIRAANARRETAAAKFAALQAQIIAEMDRAQVELQTARSQVQTAGELFAAAQRQHEAARAQGAAGAADRLDLLNAQIAFDAAALARLDSQAKLQSAIGALENALQRPTDSCAAVIGALTKNSP